MAHPHFVSRLTLAPGLFSALAAQATLTDTAQQRAQYHAVGKFPPATVPTSADRGVPPAFYAPPAADVSWQRNVTAFLRLLGTSLRSWNALNDHTPFEGVAVLRYGLAPSRLFNKPGPLRPDLYPLAPGRSEPNGNGYACNENLVRHYQQVLEVAGFDRRAPVLLDREGRILDGYHRLMACQQSGIRAYFVQLDY